MADYNVATMDAARRASIRAELTEHHDYTNKVDDDYSTSNTIVSQFIETAIHGLDAVDRVLELADQLDADQGPARAISYAIALQIRSTVKGA